MLLRSSNKGLSKRGKNKAMRIFRGIFQVLKRNHPPLFSVQARTVRDLQLVLSQSPVSRQLMFHFQKKKAALLQVEHKLSLSACVLLRR